ncbi:Asp23/Gls24 family envelope stress response protein [Streptomyces corynorhini]|uniref:Asp23/Gls24 family envelope stress response protein n=1 Tax=Streptomyces corynorhini TaxID=2282652 RepID=A0A370BDP5_9ACTN|nr:Asp23/Gls24 family envelope stress response protein [Streptomyces corynorhini]RDG38364.1 Asp23/Gls24 family envelope stress response protein [Streptomyces corynorhini]
MNTERKIQDELSLATADAARRTAGVAFLRPGIVDRLRASAASRAGRPGTGTAAGHAGVRVRALDGGPDAWHIDIQLVARTSHRTLDVTRAVRAAVAAAAGDVLSEPGDRVRVTVTVVGIV